MNTSGKTGAKLSHMIPRGHGLVIFDGECVLCNTVVRLLLKYDKSKNLYFTTLQSESLDLKSIIQVPDKNYANSVFFYYDGLIFAESQAVMEIARHLGGRWKVVLAGYLFPAFFRNVIYRIIAKNRYKWFGKRAQCFIPPEEDRYRFIS